MSNLIEEARKLSNVIIVNTPIIVHYFFEGNQRIPAIFLFNSPFSRASNLILSTCLSAQNLILENSTTLEYIKRKNEKSFFYVYEIEEHYARWHELESDIGYIQRIRKEKIQKIEIEL